MKNYFINKSLLYLCQMKISITDRFSFKIYFKLKRILINNQNIISYVSILHYRRYIYRRRN